MVSTLLSRGALLGRDKSAVVENGSSLGFDVFGTLRMVEAICRLLTGMALQPVECGI